MSNKYVGVRGLGDLDPVLRSNLMRLARAVRGLSQYNRTALLSREAEVTRGAQAVATSLPSNGGRPITSSVGLDADKPNSQFLLKRGTVGLLYFATDTNKLYAWTGTKYVSTTLS